MNTERVFVSSKIIQGTSIKELTYNIIHNGSCQCYGSCNCMDDKGKVLSVQYVFKHPLKSKHFDSFKSCIDSFNYYNKNNGKCTKAK